MKRHPKILQFLASFVHPFYEKGVKKMPNRNLWFLFLAAVLLAGSFNAQAVPLYARQTGQNCAACHLGGMYPQLTSFGRMFKLTGYTLGDRPNLSELDVTKDAPPVSIWFQTGRQWYTNVPNGSGPAPTSAYNVQAVSLFAGGKITDNIGAFLQWTGSNAAGAFNSAIDNSEVRYADHLSQGNSDLIYGVYVNNHPTVSDVWNNTANWSGNFMGFFNSGAAQAPLPFIDNYAPGDAVGAGAYLYKDNTWYGEVGVYKSFTHGIGAVYSTSGNSGGGTMVDPSPYYRLAYSKEFGPHSFEVGLHGMISYNHNALPGNPGVADWGGSVSTYRDTAIDAQYQYNLAPHYWAVHGRFVHESASNAADQVLNTTSNATNNLNEAYLDASYVYKAKYGAMLIYHNVTGSNDPLLNPLNANGNPNWTSWTPEVFWTPWQSLRVGYQYIFYTQMAGATGTIPGQALGPHDFNTSMLYLSFIY